MSHLTKLGDTALLACEDCSCCWTELGFITGNPGRWNDSLQVQCTSAQTFLLAGDPLLETCVLGMGHVWDRDVPHVSINGFKWDHAAPDGGAVLVRIPRQSP